MLNQFDSLFSLIDHFQVCGITGRSYTYSRLRDHSAALAIRLHSKLNLQIGETVAVCLPNIPEYPIAVLGAMEAGLVVTTINPIYTASEYKPYEIFYVCLDTEMPNIRVNIFKTEMHLCEIPVEDMSNPISSRIKFNPCEDLYIVADDAKSQCDTLNRLYGALFH